MTFTNIKLSFYLLLAIVGGGFTYYYAMQGVIQHDGHFDALEFIRSTWLENAYAKSLTLDFWTGATVGTFFIVAEGIRLKMKRIWIYIALTILIAFAFGFPLFLFFRELKLRKQALNQ